MNKTLGVTMVSRILQDWRPDRPKKFCIWQNTSFAFPPCLSKIHRDAFGCELRFSSDNWYLGPQASECIRIHIQPYSYFPNNLEASFAMATGLRLKICQRNVPTTCTQIVLCKMRQALFKYPLWQLVWIMAPSLLLADWSHSFDSRQC